MQEFATLTSNAMISKTKHFLLNILFHFCDLYQILNIFLKTMMIIANVFLKLQTVKNIVTPLCKKRHFGLRLESPHVKVSRILAKCPWECFYYVFSSISGKLIRKISPLALGEIWGVFVNTLTADGNYPVQKCRNLQLPTQMQLSEKRKKYF